MLTQTIVYMPYTSIILYTCTYNNSTYYLKLYDASESYFSAIIRKHDHYYGSCMTCVGKGCNKNNFAICSHIIARKGPLSITTQFYLLPKCPGFVTDSSFSHSSPANKVFSLLWVGRSAVLHLQPSYSAFP